MMQNVYKPVPDMECLQYHRTEQEPDIKIFVSHRIDLDSETVDTPPYISVRCGAVYDLRDGVAMLGDNTGDNISERRMTFCELTVQYWAWKNIEADYYGMGHYRRYLSFSDQVHPEDKYGNVLDLVLDDTAIEKYALKTDTIQKVVKGYDLILPKAQNVGKYPEKCSSVKEQYASAKNLHEKDLLTLLDTIKQVCPEYLQTADEYFSGTNAYMCNMFIMKRELFFEYSRWLFSILEAFEKCVDMTGYTDEEMRAPGHLAERLLGIFALYQRKHNPTLKIKELQPVAFLEAGRTKEKQNQLLPRNIRIRPAFPVNNIAIVFSSSELFAPYAAALVQSIMDHASPQYNYDIICIEQGISDERKRILKTMAKADNVRLRIFHVDFSHFLPDVLLGNYITSETFFRLFFPYILTEYDKIVWLDSDTIVQRDVADLFVTDIGDCLLGATKDYNTTAMLKGADPKYKKYAEKILKIEDPYQYLQAGVLLMNLCGLRNAVSLSEMIRIVQQREYQYGDQDVLNMLCKGKVYWLDNRWDVVADVDNCLSTILKYWDPDKSYLDYQIVKQAPYVIHYAGPTKPWHSPNYAMAERFWCACRETPFYEIALTDMIKDMSQGIERYGDKPDDNVISSSVKAIKKGIPQTTRDAIKSSRLYQIMRKFKK